MLRALVVCAALCLLASAAPDMDEWMEWRTKIDGELAKTKLKLTESEKQISDLKYLVHTLDGKLLNSTSLHAHTHSHCSDPGHAPPASWCDRDNARLHHRPCGLVHVCRQTWRARYIQFLKIQYNYVFHVYTLHSRFCVIYACSMSHFVHVHVYLMHACMHFPMNSLSYLIFYFSRHCAQCLF